jgi:uncharacterized protein
MKFIWDPDKSITNKTKHGVSFETAILVFDDPYHLSKMDRVIDGEERWQTIGQVQGLVILLVAHTYQENKGEEQIRIISARKATKKEIKRYEEKY